MSGGVTADATVYVGGIDDQVTDNLLWELFLQAGPVGMALISVISFQHSCGRPMIALQTIDARLAFHLISTMTNDNFDLKFFIILSSTSNN